LPAGLRPAGVPPATAAELARAPAAAETLLPPALVEVQEAGSEADKDSIAGRVWQLSQSPRGCRRVQRELDVAETDAQREAVARELHGHALEASRCPHANHVLQKMIMTLRPQAVQFVVEELAAAPISDTARHKYGCRIVQRLVEHCSPGQVADMQSELLKDVYGLIAHQFGTYVVQAILRHGAPQHRPVILEAMRRSFRKLSAGMSTCNVIAALLETLDVAGAEKLARELVGEAGLLAFMASMRRGAQVVVSLLEQLRPAERQVAVAALKADLSESKVSEDLGEYLDAQAAQLPRAAAHAGA